MKNEYLFIRKNGCFFVQQFVINVCAEFKVGRFSRHCTAVHLSALHPEIFPQQNFSNTENYNIKYHLSTFSDQIVIFKIHAVFISNAFFQLSLSVA